VKLRLADSGPVIPSRAAIALLFLAACSAVATTGTGTHEETVPNTGTFSSDVSSTHGEAEAPTIDSSLATIVVEPTTERVVGYVAIIGGVIACTILIIGFYKLAKLLGH
jgi:hypothetical protein